MDIYKWEWSACREAEQRGRAGIIEAHAEVARPVIGLEQRQPLRLRLLPRLLAPHHKDRQRGATG